MDTKTKNKLMKTLKMVYDAGFTNDKFPMIDVGRILETGLLEIQATVNEYVERRIQDK